MRQLAIVVTQIQFIMIFNVLRLRNSRAHFMALLNEVAYYLPLLS
jgi:hypothetical protein